MEALARIPRADVVRYKKPYLWSPAARPMDPVLRVGLYAEGESLNTSQIHKHVVVGRFANGCKLSGTSSVSLNAVESTKDNVLFVDVSNMPKLVEVP